MPRTHNLKDLLKLLLAHDSTLKPLRKMPESLTRYAVEFRYPGPRATSRGMKAALRHTRLVRKEMRRRLELSG